MNQAAGSGENTRLIVLISVVATIGGFLFGFDSGVINGTQDGLHQAFRSGEWMQGFEIASMLLGCAVGAFSAGRLADRLGRRNVLWLVMSVMFVGLLLSMFSNAEGMALAPILIGLVVGVGFGMAFAAVSYASTRGRRDFSSSSQLVAGRYDVLCQPRNAEQGRDLLAKLSMGTQG